VWSALTEPERLARWYGEIEGELRVGVHSAHASMPVGGKVRAASKTVSPRGGSWWCPGALTRRTRSRPR
jgi:uncharacterized protein YndB with AHSA1/START domain